MIGVTRVWSGYNCGTSWSGSGCTGRTDWGWLCFILWTSCGTCLFRLHGQCSPCTIRRWSQSYWNTSEEPICTFNQRRYPQVWVQSTRDEVYIFEVQQDAKTKKPNTHHDGKPVTAFQRFWELANPNNGSRRLRLKYTPMLWRKSPKALTLLGRHKIFRLNHIV